MDVLALLVLHLSGIGFDGGGGGSQANEDQRAEPTASKKQALILCSTGK
jgi:hypothetical protein